MMRAERLKGLAVVDLDAAEKIGTISDVIVAPGARRIAGLIVARGRTLLGRRQAFTLPASAVHALGHDAVTVRRAAADDDAIVHLGDLRRLGQVTGRKVVTESGRLVGTIQAVCIDPRDGRIVGYPLEGRAARRGLAGLLGAGAAAAVYVRGNADMRVGRELVVVRDGDLAEGGLADGAAPDSLEAAAVDHPAGEPLSGAPSRQSAGALIGWSEPRPRADALSLAEPTAVGPVPAEALEPTRVTRVDSGPHRPGQRS
jgi:sporulation protein YlmC with PRC-barrel domain